MRVCETCGVELPEQAGPGRPRTFCSSECKQLAGRIAWMTEGISKAIPMMERSPGGVEAAKRMRSELMSLANQLNTVDRRKRRRTA